MIDNELFATIIEFTPLISIDLILKNEKDQILLGLRKNEPAKGFWFVPGGRVLKDESISDAFKRISRNELGIEYNLDQSKFIGVFEHFYDNSFYGDSFSTHYIALGFVLQFDGNTIGKKEQHEEYRWFDIDELMNDPTVHKYTKNYFYKEKGIR